MGNSTNDTPIHSPTRPMGTKRNRRSLVHPDCGRMASTPMDNNPTTHKETQTINNLSMKNNKTNTPIPYTQTHTSRGQHPHQARVARNITDKTTNPPSANTTPQPIGNTPTQPQPEQHTPSQPHTEGNSQPAQPTLVKRPRGKDQIQPMMTSLPDYPAHGDSELPDHTQWEADHRSPNP